MQTLGGRRPATSRCSTPTFSLTASPRRGLAWTRSTAFAEPDGALGTVVFTAALVAILAGTVGILLRRFRKVGGV